MHTLSSQHALCFRITIQSAALLREFPPTSGLTAANRPYLPIYTYLMTRKSSLSLLLETVFKRDANLRVL